MKRGIPDMRPPATGLVWNGIPASPSPLNWHRSRKLVCAAEAEALLVA